MVAHTANPTHAISNAARTFSLSHPCAGEVRAAEVCIDKDRAAEVRSAEAPNDRPPS